MFIKSKESQMHAGKTFEMREGVNGSGNPVFLIQSCMNGKYHTERFNNEKEAEAWWKNSCN